MNRLNKKAVSAVVATVLIIMITVAAVGIIWAAIIPMVQNSLNKGTICNDALSDITLIAEKGYTCIKATTVCPTGFSSVTNTTHCNNGTSVGSANATKVAAGNISLQIKKGPNAKVELVAVDALIFVGGDSFAYRINGTDSSNNFTGIIGRLPTNNLEKTVNIWAAGIANATKVKIAPVVTVGNTEETCEGSSEVFLSPCSN